MRIGFLGLGTMGAPMAMNLKRRGGFEVTVWNRSAEKATALEAHGFAVAKSPRELAARVDAFCSCLSDPPALEEVALGADGLLAGARAGQLFVDFSTVSVPLAKRLGASFAARQIDFADAPVTGSKAGAEKGTLVVMTGCTTDTLARATPVFQAVSEKVIHCGPVGSGTQVKLAGNALIAAMLQAFSEGLLLTARAGVDPRKLLEVIQSSGFRSPYFDFKGQAILKRDFTPNFTIDLMHKDLSLFLENAASHRVPTPTAASLRETYELARAAGKGGQDIAAVVTVLEEIVGQTIS
jgi:3-hydroxyisobutyrate dehydrogenase-like beta-hydroxyacid dehydrogenase